VSASSGILSGVPSTHRAFDPAAITRPDPRLLTYYTWVAVLSLIAFPITFITLYIKYRTLRYRFDDEGIWRAQGILWRTEVNVAYRRIQDIHLTSGLLQRWLGLATVSIQTAAGSSSPEVTIEGVLEAEALRDFLYTKMRGVRDRTAGASAARVDAQAQAPTDGDEALALMIDIRDALARLESRLAAGGRP
jgi:uncharacterized membrane protein YdbT with pleckstrin-like domain